MTSFQEDIFETNRICTIWIFKYITQCNINKLNRIFSTVLQILYLIKYTKCSILHPFADIHMDVCKIVCIWIHVNIIFMYFNMCSITKPFSTLLFYSILHIRHFWIIPDFLHRELKVNQKLLHRKYWGII